MTKYVIIIALAFLSMSCIDWGLEELPLHSNAEILNFRYEYRYSVNNTNGFPRLEYRIMNNAITISGDQVTNVLTIPAPSGTFTADIASNVKLTNLVGYCDISDAARIEPLDGAPVLGTVGDWSQTRSYKVTAADGTTKVWKITTRFAN
jgi:hypothetical protein